jgi:hypothetical protein
VADSDRPSYDRKIRRYRAPLDGASQTHMDRYGRPTFQWSLLSGANVRAWWQAGRVDIVGIREVAALIHARNAIDEQIGAIVGRPALAGHLGEWVASQVFDIALEASASAKAIDGRFRSGALIGKTVNIKTYGKREGLLDTCDDSALDFYLVLCGPKAVSMTSKDGTRPWCIASVHVFDALELRAAQVARGTRSGVASSVRAAEWAAAEIYPHPTQTILPISSEQRAALARFAL